MHLLVMSASFQAPSQPPAALQTISQINLIFLAVLLGPGAFLSLAVLLLLMSASFQARNEPSEALQNIT